MDKAFAAALYADGDDGLDAGASHLAAAPEADAELRRRGEELVRRAWERGWQPADVVRMVRRAQADDPDQTPIAVLAAELITDETRRYGDTLPPRWRAQLDELAPEADPAAGSRPADRFSRATTTLTLYRLLLRLPPIEPVGPAPGTPLHIPS
ncbi:aromatic acid decarboxylase, partial [Streptomyces sp. MZ04]